MTTTQEEIFVIKRWPFDNVSPQLIIHPEYISYQNTRIEKIDIMECRFGIRWLDGLKFTIGRDYQIFIRDKKNQVLKISFKTFYGINKKVLSKKFNDILDKLWDCYFSEIVSDYLNKFGDGEAVNIANVKILSEYVIIKSAAGFIEKEVQIKWEDLGAKNYATYFALYSLSDSRNINRGYNFKDDWNTWVLQSFILTVLKHKGYDNKG